MSPPVGVLLRRINSGCNVESTNKVAPTTTAVVIIERQVSDRLLM
jgi:hypothetical protein